MLSQLCKLLIHHETLQPFQGPVGYRREAPSRSEMNGERTEIDPCIEKKIP